MTDVLEPPLVAVDLKVDGDAITAAKAELIPILAAHGIASVVYAYDGYGDEGQLDETTAFDALGAVLPLPDIACRRHDTGLGGAVAASDATLAEAVEALGYEALAASFPGWENNEGALGTITLDVAAGTLAVAHDWRVTALERDERVF